MREQIATLGKFENYLHEENFLDISIVNNNALKFKVLKLETCGALSKSQTRNFLNESH